MSFPSEAHWLVYPCRQFFGCYLCCCILTVNTAVEAAMPNGHMPEFDPYSRRPRDQNCVLMYLNINWVYRPEFIVIIDDDQISFNNGRFHGHAYFVESEHYCGETWTLQFSPYYGYQEEQRFLFRPIMGTDNWLHVNQPNETYNCILMPHENQRDSMFLDER